MLKIACKCVVLLATACLLASEARSASTGPLNAEGVARLIDQLGSKKFRERELAARELEAAGPVALAALEKAGHHADPEISRRAESLAQRIQKRIETAQILEPKRVHLRYHDTPLDQAIADFAGKTGFTIHVPAGAHEHKITLDTGDTTFWEALDQFCGKAGVVEQIANLQSHVPAQEVRVWNARGGQAQVQMMVMNGSRMADSNPVADHAVRLTLGKAPALPTSYAGAVRIRALPADELRRLSTAKGEGAVLLEAAPQQKMGWQGLLDVCVEKAIDENGRPLSCVTDPKATPSNVAARMLNAAEADAFRRAQIVDPQKALLRFNLDESPAKTLKELKGSLFAQVQTPMQPLVTVDDVLKSAGRTVKGRDGRSITVTEVTRESDGNIKMRVSLEEPVPAGIVLNRRLIMRANRVQVRNGVVIGGGIMRETGVAGESKMTLLDAQGRTFPLEVNAYGMSIKGTNVVQDLQMTFQAHANQGEPVKFVYSDHRLVNFEIPFVLKDVPLATK